MIVYHGSNHSFRQLRISKNLVSRGSTVKNEGYGIYFSEFKDVAESYGKYLYTLEINNADYLDFRHSSVCLRYVNAIANAIYAKTGVWIASMINLQGIVDYMHHGGIAISGTCDEIALNLDSSEKWYNEVSQTNKDKILCFLRNYDRKHLKAYSFTYHIKGVGVIKSVEPEVARIVNKECLGKTWG